MVLERAPSVNVSTPWGSYDLFRPKIDVWHLQNACLFLYCKAQTAWLSLWWGIFNNWDILYPFQCLSESYRLHHNFRKYNKVLIFSQSWYRSNIYIYIYIHTYIMCVCVCTCQTILIYSHSLYCDNVTSPHGCPGYKSLIFSTFSLNKVIAANIMVTGGSMEGVT